MYLTFIYVFILILQNSPEFRKLSSETHIFLSEDPQSPHFGLACMLILYEIFSGKLKHRNTGQYGILSVHKISNFYFWFWLLHVLKWTTLKVQTRDCLIFTNISTNESWTLVWEIQGRKLFLLWHQNTQTFWIWHYRDEGSLLSKRKAKLFSKYPVFRPDCFIFVYNIHKRPTANTHYFIHYRADGTV